MAAQLGNYVLETATSPGTGGFTLNGAEANRRAFSTAFPIGGNVLYFADDGSQAEWGIGTLTVGTPSTLARSTVLGNTAGTKVALNFPGSVEVYNEIPAEMVPVLEQDGSLTLAGSLTVKGKALVQNVADFTSQEAIPAAQADARYIRSPANPGTDYRIQTLSRNKFSGGIFAFAEDGSNTQLQPAGDYATNPALSTEASNRASADTNLQNQVNNRVLKSGDTSTGTQTISNRYSSGNLHWAPGLTSVLSGMRGGKSNGDYSFSLFAQTLDGSYTAGILSVNGFRGRMDTRFNEDGNIFTPLGTVALTSQLPFTDKNLRVQVFNAIASNGAFVRLPQAFRTLVGVTAQQHTSGGEGIRPIRIETNVFRGDGFNVSIWAQGGGIQYTFVAYGYF